MTCDDIICDQLEADIPTWIPVEEGAFIQKAMVSDLYEESLSAIDDSNTNDQVVDQYQDANAEAKDPLPLPSVYGIRGRFEALEGLAVRLQCYPCN